jgi:hypothetical protein
MSIDSIGLWHKRARPNPSHRDFDVQLGCHLEEVVEMLATVDFSYTDEFGSYPPVKGHNTAAYSALKQLADNLKSGATEARITDRKELLDSLADQIVTSVGVGHCAHMDVTEACVRVNSSNFSKYDDNGQPLRDANGKIAKGPRYAPPDLEGLY